MDEVHASPPPPAMTERLPSGAPRCWRSKATTPKGYVCTLPQGHLGDCLLLYRPSRWRQLGDTVGEVVAALLSGGRVE